MSQVVKLSRPEGVTFSRTEALAAVDEIEAAMVRAIAFVRVKLEACSGDPAITLATTDIGLPSASTVCRWGSAPGLAHTRPDIGLPSASTVCFGAPVTRIDAAKVGEVITALAGQLAEIYRATPAAELP